MLLTLCFCYLLGPLFSHRLSQSSFQHPKISIWRTKDEHNGVLEIRLAALADHYESPLVPTSLFGISLMPLLGLAEGCERRSGLPCMRWPLWPLQRLQHYSIYSSYGSYSAPSYSSSGSSGGSRSTGGGSGSSATPRCSSRRTEPRMVEATSNWKPPLLGSAGHQDEHQDER